MALLRTRWPLKRASPLVVLALLGLGVTGCMLANVFSTPEKTLAFSHRVHIADQGLGCADCHRAWEKSDEPGMPSAKQCALCHEELDAEKPEDRKVASLFEEKKFKRSHTLALTDELVFSHQKHATRGDECVVCHTSLEQNDRVAEVPVFTMDTCTKCHAERQVSNDCAQCHKEIRADEPPPNHLANWQRMHGRAVRACTGATSERCDLCHKESSCESCHLTQPPENHTNYFRLRGHGIRASMDRQTCAACHQPDACDRCHSNEQPQSHGGGWGAPTDLHCMACHEPLQNESCYVCHKDQASHAQATPLPPDHNAGMNCRLCHGNGQPLPHFDNGQQCTLCHR